MVSIQAVLKEDIRWHILMLFSARIFTSLTNNIRSISTNCTYRKKEWRLPPVSVNSLVQCVASCFLAKEIERPMRVTTAWIAIKLKRKWHVEAVMSASTLCEFPCYILCDEMLETETDMKVNTALSTTQWNRKYNFQEHIFVCATICHIQNESCVCHLLHPCQNIALGYHEVRRTITFEILLEKRDCWKWKDKNNNWEKENSSDHFLGGIQFAVCKTYHSFFSTAVLPEYCS